MAVASSDSLRMKQYQADGTDSSEYHTVLTVLSTRETTKSQKQSQQCRAGFAKMIAHLVDSLKNQAL